MRDSGSLLLLAAVGIGLYYAYKNGYLAMLGMCPSGTVAISSGTSFGGKVCATPTTTTGTMSGVGWV